MSKELCWECKEKWEREHGVGNIHPSNFDWLHCHHEPKEKPKCWCELTSGITCCIIFCPECGKPL